MGRFNPGRLRVARKRRKLTGAQLAELAGVTAATVSKAENSTADPRLETIELLANALDYPVGFFYGGDIEEVRKEQASFRSLKSMKAATREAALAASSLAFLLSDWVEKRFKLPVPELLDMSHERDPIAAARQVRTSWGLGEQPVPNMVDLLEAKGVRVFSLAEDTLAVDAYSCWRGDIPYIFLNTRKSAERSRLDAAHELAHLCLHKHGSPPHRDAEFEANTFAAHFLMPEADVRSRIIYISSLDQIMRAKTRWGVSIGAMTYHLAKLGILSEWQARGHYIEITRRGYRTKEPDPMSREASLIWKTVFQELWKERVTKTHIARSLDIPQGELESIVFGLAGNVDNRSALVQSEKVGPRMIN